MNKNSKEVNRRRCGMPLVLSCVVLAVFATAANSQSSFQGELLKLARQAERFGKVQEAERLYDQTLVDNPNNQFAHHRLAVLAASRGELKKAVEHFASAMDAGPPSAQLLSDYGGALFLKDDLEQAEQKLKAALTLDPQNRGARNNLDLVLEKLNIRREAEARAREKAREAANSQAMAKLKVDETARAAAKALADVRTAEKARAIAEARAAAELRAAADALAKARAAEQARKIVEARAADEARKLAKARAADQSRTRDKKPAADDLKKLAKIQADAKPKKMVLSSRGARASTQVQTSNLGPGPKRNEAPTTAKARPAAKTADPKIATVKRQSNENQAQADNVGWHRSDGRYPTTSAKILAPTLSRGVKGAIVRYIEPPKSKRFVYRIHDLERNNDSQKGQAANEEQAEQEDEAQGEGGDQAEGIKETQAEKKDGLLEPPLPNLHSLFLPHTKPFHFSASGVQQAAFSLPLRFQPGGHKSLDGAPSDLPLHGTFTRLLPIKPADGSTQGESKSTESD